MHRSSPGTRSSPRRTWIARVFCSSDRATACVQHAAPLGSMQHVGNGEAEDEGASTVVRGNRRFRAEHGARAKPRPARSHVFDRGARSEDRGPRGGGAVALVLRWHGGALGGGGSGRGGHAVVRGPVIREAGAGPDARWT